MPQMPAPLVWDCFSELPDPRRARGRRHKLIDILAVALYAVLCGADDFTEIEGVRADQKEWLRQFLELPHGIPSHDTFRRVFAALDPRAFERCFMGCVREVAQLSEGAVIAIDDYLSSVPVDAVKFGEAVRGHWSVENSCHWVLDVVFGEDD